jgi:ribosomal-protein-alanine N-acetyltransferase
MTTVMCSSRLQLEALSMVQLERLLNDSTKLESDLNLTISKNMVDTNVTRAINLKLNKMANVNSSLHDWFTYWLIVIKSIRISVGLIGFKGNPGINGKTEIGYGIDPLYRNQGYMTESLQALTKWAFSHPECQAITASSVSNPASKRILEKSGWQKVVQSTDASDWEICKIIK